MEKLKELYDEMLKDKYKRTGGRIWQNPDGPIDYFIGSNISNSCTCDNSYKSLKIAVEKELETIEGAIKMTKEELGFENDEDEVYETHIEDLTNIKSVLVLWLKSN